MPTPIAQPSRFGTTVLILLALVLAALVLPGGALAAPEEGNGTLTASPLTLPPNTVNYQSSPQSIQLSYEGEGEVSINKVTIEGEEAGEFLFNGANCASSLGNGQSCETYVASKATNLGLHHAWLTIVYNGPRPEDRFELSDRGVAPQLTVEPASIDFGLVRANRETLFETVQVKNTGEAEVTFNFVDFQMPPGENAFWTESNGSTCWGSNLAPGQSCALRVAFSPHQRIGYAAEMRVFVNNVPSAAGAATVSGEGGGATVQATENPVSFGAASAGSSGAVRTITLENTGNFGEAFFIGVVAGGDAGSFELLSEHCTMHELAPGHTCSAQVRFHPLTPGALSAHLAFFGEGEGGVMVQLEGEGLLGAASIAPGSFDFGTQAANTRSASHVFTVTNAGSAPLGFDHVSIGGAEQDQFVVSGDDCSGDLLAPAESCEVRVRFAPDSAGVKHAVLRVSGDAPAVASSLTGTGVEPPPSVSQRVAPPAAASSSKAKKHRHRHPHSGSRFVRRYDVRGGRHARR